MAVTVTNAPYLEVYYLFYAVPVVVLTVWLFYRNHYPLPWPTPNDFIPTLAKHVETDGFWGNNKDFQRMPLTIMEAYDEHQQQQARDPTAEARSSSSSLFISHGENRFQMLQFYPSSNDDREGSPKLYKGLPMIPIARWGNASNWIAAQIFLNAPPASSRIPDKKKTDSSPGLVSFGRLVSSLV